MNHSKIQKKSLETAKDIQLQFGEITAGAERFIEAMDLFAQVIVQFPEMLKNHALKNYPKLWHFLYGDNYKDHIRRGIEALEEGKL